MAVRSGHKVGKSTSAAIIALWYVCLHERATVIMTSASYRQVRDILWKEVLRIYRSTRFPIGGTIRHDPNSGLRFADGRSIVGFSTDTPERMAGISGPNVLFLLDEASGIPRPIFEAIEGNRAGGARVAMFSNPTQTSGEFYDAFATKAEFWHRIHVSSEETPNARGLPGVPGLATKAWVAEKRKEWGVESPIYQVRVRGEFPTAGDDTVIPLGLVQEATARAEEGEGTLHLGVDVARFGDDESVIAPRRGKRAYPLLAINGFDLVELAALVVRVARDMHVRGEEKPRVKVDGIGVGGGLVDILRTHSEELEVIDVNVGESASDEEHFFNLRAEVAFGLRDWLREGGALPRDPRLESELVATHYFFDGRGRLKIEPKDDVKGRIGRSPDRADALALAVYDTGSALYVPGAGGGRGDRFGSEHRGYG